MLHCYSEILASFSFRKGISRADGLEGTKNLEGCVDSWCPLHILARLYVGDAPA